MEECSGLKTGARRTMAAKPKVVKNTEEKQISAAVRTMAVLEALSEGGSFTFDALVEKVGLAKPTLFRFLKTLKSLGYVLQHEDSRYSLSLKMLTVGSKALGAMELHDASRPVIKRLAKYFKETVHLAILMDAKVVYIQKVESVHTIRMYSTIGKQAPLHCTSLGKALLAWNPDREKIVKKLELVPYTRNTIVTSKSLLAELDAIRELGYSTDNEEHEPDIRCIGAPVFDYSGSVIAAVSVAWPVYRYKPEEEPKNAATIMAAAKEISTLMGYEAE
jgi:IclR family KDG regulon transcriptional repressor